MAHLMDNELPYHAAGDTLHSAMSHIELLYVIGL